MSVVDAVKRDLAGFARFDAGLAESALAASALAIAARMDTATTTPTALSNCSRELRENLDRIRALLPEDAVVSPLDRIRERRDRKLAG